MTEGAWDLVLEVAGDEGTPEEVRLPKVVRVRAGGGGTPSAVTLRVRANVSGVDFDPAFTVVNETGCSGSGCPRTALPYAGQVEYQLPSGAYSIRLDDVAPNCTVTSPNPATIQVRTGTTVDLFFRVSCTALSSPAVVRVGVTATGSNVDGAVRVACENNACIPRDLRPNGPPLEYRLPAGTYRFVLGDVATNCRVTGANPVALTVAAATSATVEFALSCVGPGVIRIAVTTTGTDLDDAFLAEIFDTACEGDPGYAGCATLPVAAGGAADYATYAAGAVTVFLNDVAVNCNVDGGSRRDVTPMPGDTVMVTFAVACRPAARVRISVAIDGYQPPGVGYAAIEGGDCYYAPCSQYPLNGTTGEFIVEEGLHTLRLTGYSPYLCRPTSPESTTVTAVAGTTVDVTYRLSCLPPAVARVSVAVSGSNQDTTFRVDDLYNCDYYTGACAGRIVAPGAVADYELAWGAGAWFLADVAPNCRVLSANPIEVLFAPAGTSTDVRFTVACE
jgi:hypothetical protein